MIKITLVISILFVVLGIPSAMAEEARSEWVLRDKAKTSDEEINAGSDASFDKRLPPVLPGEEVNDSGKRMKVWSTTGGVPVADAPEATRRKRNKVRDIDVIVDGRKAGERRERSEDR